MEWSCQLTEDRYITDWLSGCSTKAEAEQAELDSHVPVDSWQVKLGSLKLMAG